MEYLITIPIVYIVLNTIYILIFSIASLWPIHKKSFEHSLKQNKIAVLIPAYREDGVIIDSALQASSHDYPKEKYEVFVIADQLQAPTIIKLDRMDVQMIEVKFEKSSKAKALNSALCQIMGYDIAVVLDADNIMKSDFLKEINKEYNNGALAIQGQRIAKNEQNTLAQLDAISEAINNNIFRKGHQNLGLSSALIGSGMAFDFELFRSHMSNIKALGGFDKELELSLLRAKIKISYLPEAQVWDEKISDHKSFSNQRTRWIAAQIRFGIKSFQDGVVQLVSNRNIDYFDKVIQFVFLPRLILLGSLSLCSLLTFFISESVFSIFFISLSVCTLSLLTATPRQYLSIRNLMTIRSLPMIFFKMIFAISGYKKAANNFLHTNHTNYTQP